MTTNETLTDHDRIEAVLGALSDAWNDNDADAYGALFTEDASYVTFFGQVSRGRTAIVDGHRWLFARMPGSRMTHGATADREIRFLTSDTAVVVGQGPGTIVPGRESATDRISTVGFVVVRTDAGWRFAHFQNTRLQAPPA
ncbi:MAG TPA: SgcJ/EcaC family oxidoreductase [Actinomycetospora sp.]|jgi:uncharacterized protein (TIGR02246 family)|uniref:SgcJ/EcaC family oxidoreductase n=1 Tax=Actinomycetospora sp. TaxID=1872135 RepID=UPI002F3EED21